MCPFSLPPPPPFQLLQIPLCGCRMFSLLLSSSSHELDVSSSSHACMFSLLLSPPSLPRSLMDMHCACVCVCVCKCEAWYLHGMLYGYAMCVCGSLRAGTATASTWTSTFKSTSSPPESLKSFPDTRCMCVCVSTCVHECVCVNYAPKLSKLFFAHVQKCICSVYVCVCAKYLKLL